MITGTSRVVNTERYNCTNAYTVVVGAGAQRLYTMKKTQDNNIAESVDLSLL